MLRLHTWHNIRIIYHEAAPTPFSTSPISQNTRHCGQLSFLLYLVRQHQVKMRIGNIYLITAISVIGGGLFGFDISSMSAVYVPLQYSICKKAQNCLLIEQPGHPTIQVLLQPRAQWTSVQ